MAYTPKPGSLAERAVAHLKTLVVGREITTSELCEATGASSSVLITSMGVAISHGLVARRKSGKTSMWSAGAGEPVAATEADDETPEFNAALWADGDLVIYGAQENTDGSVTLNAGQVAQIKRLIAWSPAA